MPDAPKHKYIAALGDQNGKIFYNLWQEWAHAKDRLDEYNRLYSADTADLLNMISPGFFGDLQYILVDDLVLRLSRLTDKNRRSVSVHKLPRVFTDQPDLRQKTIDYAEKAAKYAESAKDWRNRKIAHLDMRRIAGGIPLKELNIRQIRKGLESVLGAMNVVELHVFGSGILNHVSSPARVDTLVSFLHSSVEAMRFIDSKILQGQPRYRAATALLDVVNGNEQDLEVARKIVRLAYRIRREHE